MSDYFSNLSHIDHNLLSTRTSVAKSKSSKTGFIVYRYCSTTHNYTTVNPNNLNLNTNISNFYIYILTFVLMNQLMETSD